MTGDDSDLPGDASGALRNRFRVAGDVDDSLSARSDAPQQRFGALGDASEKPPARADGAGDTSPTLAKAADALPKRSPVAPEDADGVPKSSLQAREPCFPPEKSLGVLMPRRGAVVPWCRGAVFIFSLGDHRRLGYNKIKVWREVEFFRDMDVTLRCRQSRNLREC